jgi:hypothetical protein
LEEIDGTEVISRVMGNEARPMNTAAMTMFAWQT